MAFSALALMLASSTIPEIRVEPVEGRGFLASIGEFDSGNMSKVQERLGAIGDERCGKGRARFGRFFYDSKIDVERSVTIIANMRQSFFCFDPKTDPYKPVPANWTASAAETASATAFVTRFLDRFNRDDVAGMGMMDPLIEIQKSDWDGLRKAAMQNRTSNAPGTLTPRLIGWANNPDGAAYPGAYAFFSVIDNHPGIIGTCGSVMVHRVRENEFRIAHYDVQYVAEALAVARGLSQSQLDQLCAR